MQGVTNIYPPENITSKWAVSAISIAIGLAIGYFVAIRLAKIIALRRQEQLLKRRKPNVEAIIAHALQEIEQIQAELLAHRLLPDKGAEQLSTLVRQTYDTLMNHTTIKQARYEIAMRNLDKVVGFLNYGYPVEFSNSQQLDENQVIQLCDTARGVVQSCT